MSDRYIVKINDLNISFEKKICQLGSYNSTGGNIAGDHCIALDQKITTPVYFVETGISLREAIERAAGKPVQVRVVPDRSSHDN